MEIGEVIGWRAWRVVEDDGEARLASVLHEDVWPADAPLVATCERGHSAPDYECTCGIYASKRLEPALPYRVGRDDARTLGRVVGLVVLSGDVIEHRDGWRASHARPLGLIDGQAPGRVAARSGIVVPRWRSAMRASLESRTSGTRLSARTK